MMVMKMDVCGDEDGCWTVMVMKIDVCGDENGYLITYLDEFPGYI